MDDEVEDVQQPKKSVDNFQSVLDSLQERKI